ncbi:helix-turn-helix domain-containing protein [Paenibacillus glacialis]|uniref:HTH cro/C1-type domain-containing protein n=1 Tax=Paenibacillus glacialis TaxID=494026 RepID=A0A168F6G1_9BACL|nr:helix-turn-helix transcriptional regulator [Paenibacillus glacialis]OAB35906.1 hypothetical protein PGLA_20955 [Paenibacillus glacialis]
MNKTAENPFDKILGERIQSRRKEAFITQESLAEMVGTSLENLKRIEQGNGYPSFPLFINIANSLGRGTDYFLFDPTSVQKRSEELASLESIYLKLSRFGRQTLINIGEELVNLQKKENGE